MKLSVVHKWFLNQSAKGIERAYTIREVYKSMNLTSDKRCIETIWFQIVKLKESGVLGCTLSIPVKYYLIKE